MAGCRVPHSRPSVGLEWGFSSSGPHIPWPISAFLWQMWVFSSRTPTPPRCTNMALARTAGEPRRAVRRGRKPAHTDHPQPRATEWASFAGFYKRGCQEKTLLPAPAQRYFSGIQPPSVMPGGLVPQWPGSAVLGSSSHPRYDIRGSLKLHKPDGGPAQRANHGSI